MWAVALENEKHFEKLIAALNPLAHYDVQTTGTGARIAVAGASKKDPNEKFPHFFLVDSNPELAKHAISWVHKNLHPAVFISADISDDWQGPSSEPHIFIPFSCLRSAGRIDMGGGPILFEEIPFDPWVQSTLRKHFSLNSGSNEKKYKIFACDRTIHKAAEQKWLSDNLHCQSYDTFSGELQLAGKRLGINIGCVKILSSHPKALGQFVDLWSTFRLPNN